MGSGSWRAQGVRARAPRRPLSARLARPGPTALLRTRTRTRAAGRPHYMDAGRNLELPSSPQPPVRAAAWRPKVPRLGLDLDLGIEYLNVLRPSTLGPGRGPHVHVRERRSRRAACQCHACARVRGPRGPCLPQSLALLRRAAEADPCTGPKLKSTARSLGRTLITSLTWIVPGLEAALVCRAEWAHIGGAAWAA